MEKIRLILADDHPLIREGFRSLLGRNKSFEIVSEVENGRELVESAKQLSPDIVLADISMPHINGIEAMAEILKHDDSIRFIILTMHEEREYIMNALQAGARGYILKNVDAPELEKAILTIYKGGKYFSPAVTSILAESVIKPSQKELLDITPREKEVLSLVANGYSTKQIADSLNISIRTVESHRINMLKKMKVSNSAELIRKCIELQII
jgi:DNA-binding NarL/FixJ family response regulator